jgi:hypothetical protein
MLFQMTVISRLDAWRIVLVHALTAVRTSSFVVWADSLASAACCLRNRRRSDSADGLAGNDRERERHDSTSVMSRSTDQ